MKRITLLIISFIVAYGTLAAKSVNTDTTKVFNSENKRIVVTENDRNDRIDVQVYELNDDQDSVLYEKIFEGHYRDGKSSEKRKYMATINIPKPGWNKHSFDPHWAGFGIGFADFSNGGDSDDIPLRASKSLEYNLNVFERAIPISRHYRWAVVTGAGIRWTRYRIKGDRHFEEIDDYTYLVEAPENRNYKKSKLGITSITIPLLLEWQNPKGNLFFSGGAVGVIKTWSSSKIEYTEGNSGKKHKEKVDGGMTLRPVTMDLLLQAGTRHWGAYLKYSPISLFEHKKGPELYPVSIGIMWHLF